MDWNEAGEINRKALRRLVALLLALADLAERAAGRSRPVRHLVLWFLRQAEEIARDHVAGLTRAAFPPAPAAILYESDSAADAMRLALGFRALAAALAVLTAEAFASWRAGSQILCSGFAGSVTGAPAALRDWTVVLAAERLDSS